MEPKELEIRKEPVDIKQITDVDEADDSIPEQPAQPQPVQINPTASTEVILLEQGRIHLGSILQPINIVAAVLLDLLKQKDVQNIFNPKEKTKQNNYCG